MYNIIIDLKIHEVCSDLNSILNNDLMMLIKNKNFVYLTFIYSLFVVFLGIFHLQLGIIQISEIIFNLSLSIFFYLVFNAISNRFSLRIEPKTLYSTDEKSKEQFIEDNNMRAKPKIIWKYKKIFIIQLCLGVLFIFFVGIPLTYIFTVIHEFSHAIVGLFSGIQIEKIRILGPREGYTNHSMLSSNVIMSLFSIAGSMGEILFESVLLILIYRNKSLKLKVFIPIYCVIAYNIIYNPLYWLSSVYKGKGDAAAVLFYNSQISHQLLLTICIIVLIGLILLLGFLLMRKIIHRKNLFMKNNHPELLDKQLYQIVKELFLKKT